MRKGRSVDWKSKAARASSGRGRKAELLALTDKFNEDTPFAECSLDYLICSRLIHGERNIAVHEVEQTYSDPWTFLGPDGSFDLGDIYRPWAKWICGATGIVAIVRSDGE